MRRSVLLFVSACASVTPAFADIPVTDAAQLTQKSETASTTVKLVPVTTDRKSANSGVKCAVTTGKKANVTDPTVQPQSGAGAKAIQTYGPNLPATPDPSAQGATLSTQTLFKSAGDIVAGGDASRSTMSAASSAFQMAGLQVGTAATVMAALDMNSGARLQNNLSWNGVINSANFWVLALNALNLALVSDTSRAASAMRATIALSSSAAAAACPMGTIGSGTAADPCRSISICSTTPAGTPTDPACVTTRYVDTNGNVIFYLAQAQGAAVASSSLTTADVAAALAAILASSK